MSASLVPPTRSTRLALELTALTIVVSATYLILQYPSLPDLLAVQFQADGLPMGWQFRTPARVMMPVLVQIALALTFLAVSLLLLTRPHGKYDANAGDVRAARPPRPSAPTARPSPAPTARTAPPRSRPRQPQTLTRR